MTRKKVQLAYIPCDTARKSTYKKRKKGLLKKMDELTTLCGVEACAVIYSPYEPDAVVWPSPEKAKEVVDKFRQLPEMDQHRKMYDHPAYLKQRVNKATQQLTRLQRENREREVLLAMHGCLSNKRGLEGLTMLDLNDLCWMVERSIKEVNLRLQKLGYGGNYDNDGGKNEKPGSENPKPQNDTISPIEAELQLQSAIQSNSMNHGCLMAPPPLSLSTGFFGVRSQEVGPGMGQFLGMGFGNSNYPQKQMQASPTMQPIGQYYPAPPLDGASSSGQGYVATGENPSALFGGVFH